MKVNRKAALVGAFSLLAVTIAFPAPDSKTINALLKQGADAFDAGDLAQSRDAFSDALSADPANLTAARDLGIVYLWMDKTAAAIKPLELASGSKTMDRSLVLAIAAERLSGIAKNVSPMQVVKMLKGYLEEHQKANAHVDEAMLNALGLALSKAEEGGITSTNTLYAEACAYYKKLNARLEADRPGEKRWGPQWMPADDVATKQKTLDDALATIKEDNAKLRQLASDIASTKAEKAAVPYTEGNNNMTQKADAIQRRIDKYEADQKEVQTSLTAARKTLNETKPTWPDMIPREEMPLDPASQKLQTAPTGAKSDDSAVTPAASPNSDSVAAVKPAGHVTRYAVAFAIAPNLLVTPSSTLVGMTQISVQITAGPGVSAEVVRSDTDSGLTLLKLTDVSLPSLPLATELKAGPAKCEGFPTVSIFQPIVQELKSTLVNTQDHWTASLEKSPRLPGGPLLVDGKVVGVEMADRDTDPSSTPVVTVALLRQLVKDDAKAIKPLSDPKVAVFQIVASR